MNTHDQSLASAADEYFAARDKARQEDRRRRQHEKAACPKGEFKFNGQKVFNLAHLETMRPGAPMTPDELQEVIGRLQRGNALLVEEYPEKVAAFEEALQRARAHFEAHDAARKAAGLGDAADDDDDRWQAIEALEIDAWSTKVETLGDVAGLLRLLQDHVNEMGNLHDHLIESRLMDRLKEGIALLGAAKQ
jgi:hypothetical protein